VKKSADYKKLIEKFGAKPFNQQLKKKLGKTHKLMKLGFIFAHRDFDKYLEMYKRGGRVAIVSGRGPSNYLHLGHLLLFEFIKYLQELLEAEVYIPLSDDEKYFFRKVRNLEEAYKYAIDNALDIISIGYDPEKTHLYVSTKTGWVYPLSVELSRHLTFSTVRATFGFTDETNPGAIFYGAVQAAHILGPTILKGYPVTVPIGMDQDTYMRLTRDIAGKIRVFKPASLYIRFLRGLTGEPMSASNPETCIFTVDDSETVKRKIWEAFTGGRATVKEQKLKGGEPDKCVIFEWLSAYYYEDLKEILEHREKCIGGGIICGECKRMLSEKIVEILVEHRRRREKYRDLLSKYFEHEI